MSGDLVELWFDGGTMDPVLAPKVTALLAKLQPKAVCFQGPTAKQAIRWAGSESGDAPEPNWSTSRSSVTPGHGDPDAEMFAPSESDVTLSGTGEWYWRPGQPIKSLAFMTTIYERTVGHNSNLLLNFALTYSGQQPSESIRRFKELGDWVRGCFGTPVSSMGTAQVASGEDVTMAVSSSKPIGRIVIMEDQTLGQRIRRFTVEVMPSASGQTIGAWQTVVTAESVGHKRIVALNTSSSLSSVRLTVLDSVGAARIRSMAVYAAEGCVTPPAPPAAPCELVEDYEYSGVALNTLAGQSVPECCAACRKDARCVGFARKLSGHCELFKALGGATVVEGSISGSPTRGGLRVSGSKHRPLKADDGAVQYAAIGLAAEMSGSLKVVIGKVQKHPSSPLWPDAGAPGAREPWDHPGLGYPNVIYDPDEPLGKYRLWYSGNCREGCPPPLTYELFANSSDGLTWEKPALGLYPKVNGGKNNILPYFLKSGGIGVYLDPSQPRGSPERFKAVGTKHEAAGEGTGGVFTSHDGFTWGGARSIEWPEPHRYDCHNNMFYSERRQQYVVTTRDANFLNCSCRKGEIPWNASYCQREIGLGFSEAGKGFVFNASRPTPRSLSGTLSHQLYSQITFPWLDVWLGLVMVYEETNPHNLVRCRLAWTRDIFAAGTPAGEWTWVDEGGLTGKEFIPLNSTGERAKTQPTGQAFDSHLIFASRPVHLPDHERLYYVGSNGPHSGCAGQEQTAPFCRNASLGLATLRKDGFAGVSGTGTLTTRPLTVGGKGVLTLSVDVLSGGSVRVGVRNGASFLPGLSPADCTPVTSNRTNSAVLGTTMSHFVGKNVTVEMALDDAVVYTVGWKSDDGPIRGGSDGSHRPTAAPPAGNVSCTYEHGGKCPSPLIEMPCSSNADCDHWYYSCHSTTPVCVKRVCAAAGSRVCCASSNGRTCAPCHPSEKPCSEHGPPPPPPPPPPWTGPVVTVGQDVQLFVDDFILDLDEGAASSDEWSRTKGGALQVLNQPEKLNGGQAVLQYPRQRVDSSDLAVYEGCVHYDEALQRFHLWYMPCACKFESRLVCECPAGLSDIFAHRLLEALLPGIRHLRRWSTAPPITSCCGSLLTSTALHRAQLGEAVARDHLSERE